MDATGFQNPGQSVHTGTPRSWVGVGAAMVLILTVLTIGIARDVGETTRPALNAPVAEVQVGAPARDLVLHGRGLVDMPDLVTTAGGPAAATKSTAGTSNGGVPILPSQARCPAKPGC